MSNTLLTINVGNTRCQFAVFVDEQMHDVHYVAHENSDALAAELTNATQGIADADTMPIYLASTNAAAAKRVVQAVQSVLDGPISRIETDVNVPVGRKLDRESITGEDRLLNAAAAYDKLKQACIVVDAGTAVTVDFIDGEGTFHGGAILPGARMMLNAMHQHTAQLPEIRIKKPDELIGHNTAEAMLTGVYHGVRGAVRELCEKFAEHYGAYPKIIATGGDAPLLFAEYDLIEELVPELTLRGMYVTRRYEREQND